ncbi:MAG: G protein-coupled receptor LGR4 [Phycisphaera sp.]|nr:G protein-coupled receptor LGR4 [Phycisphaera sp.]
MNRTHALRLMMLLCLVTAAAPTLRAGSLDEALAKVTTKADLDAVIASTKDAAVKAALQANADAVLAAAERHGHVEAVIATIAQSPGRFEKINTTPDELKKAAGGELALFDTLSLVDNAIPNAGPHDHRKVDPYDQAFFEHLGHITSLEYLNIIATKLSDEWIAPLGNLTNLKTLKLTNNGKLTDTGLEKLAPLNKLEYFNYVGTKMQGHAFAKFEGWTHLTKVSFRGSNLDDEGLTLFCDHFPTTESLSLAHAKFTDAGGAHLAKLTRLKRLELGTHEATPKTLTYVQKLPLEYLQLGEGFESREAIALIKDLPTMRQLTLEHTADLTEDDFKLVTGMTQLEHLELGQFPLTEERLPQLKGLAFLKSFRLLCRPAIDEAMQAKVQTLLPNTAIKFN